MKGTPLVYRAPAKVNLLLEVLGRRADGYHELALVFQTVSLEDELEVYPADSDVAVRVEGIPVLPADGTNLVAKAAQVFFEHTRLRGGVSILLRKRIPIAAGLGGGSSDAAATLIALNELYAANLPPEDLAALAASLGSDVPFFLVGGTALGRGRGEVLERLPDLPETWFALVKPGEGLSTGAVYGSGLVSFTDGSRALGFGRRGGVGIPETARGLFNALEEPAFKLLPECRRIRDELLDAGCLGALVSGSGSTVFGIARDEAAAGEAALRSARPGRFTAAVKSVPYGVRRIESPSSRRIGEG
jgi:4-diphosphocytidyl-2-C-methyl-D-erythritol kinase